MGDLTAFITARLDDAEAKARDLLRTAQDVRLALQEPRLLGREIPGWHSWPDVEAMCNSRLADIALKRAILAEHARVERSHEIVICAVCWTVGRQTGAHLEGDPYPCATVRQLGTEFSDHADYRPEWAQPSDT